MSESVYEDRARAAKSYKLAAVVGRVLASSPTITLADIETADVKFRERVAVLAKVNPPSERSWAVMCQLLAERAHPPDDPFDGLS